MFKLIGNAIMWWRYVINLAEISQLSEGVICWHFCCQMFKILHFIFQEKRKERRQVITRQILTHNLTRFLYAPITADLTLILPQTLESLELKLTVYLQTQVSIWTVTRWLCGETRWVLQLFMNLGPGGVGTIFLNFTCVEAYHLAQLLYCQTSYWVVPIDRQIYTM